jgi:hypothetical protein
MVAGDLGVVASAAITDGEAGLQGLRLEVLRPVSPMLAGTASDAADALARIHPAEVEWKLDGVRLQVHVSHGDVRAFARTLADVTDRARRSSRRCRASGSERRSSTGRRSRSGPTADRIRSRSRAAGSRAASTSTGSAGPSPCRRSSSTSSTWTAKT